MIQFGQIMPVVVYVDGKMAANKGEVPEKGFTKIHDYLIEHSVEGLDPIEPIKTEEIRHDGNLTLYDKLNIVNVMPWAPPVEKDVFAHSVLTTNRDYDRYLTNYLDNTIDNNTRNLKILDHLLQAAGVLRVYLNNKGDVNKVECQPEQTTFQAEHKAQMDRLKPPSKPV